MIRIGILGATGYTALELIKILLRHPEAQITLVTSRQQGEPHISTVHPSLVSRLDLCLQDASVEAIVDACDCVFSCLPHAASASAVKPLVDAGLRVVDFSADYRLNDAEVYAQWYGQDHEDPDRVGRVPYGLPELFGEKLREAPLVANPGCYPTSAILALAPMLKEKLIEPHGIIIDSKSGVSGAGRNPKLTTHYPECNESITAYNIGRHRHTPEIDQVLGVAAGTEVNVIFTPHLVPMDRGILTTAYATPTGDRDENDLLSAMRDFYEGRPFVRVVEHLPATKDTVGTNFCDITVRVVRDRVVLISSIDNLIKGASGAAVQNFNCMYGFAETTGLL